MYKKKSSEDYLEAILVIHKEKGVCRSIDVANHLGYSKPSVSVAMGKLREQGLIVKHDDGRLELTAEGLRTAEGILHKHTFLVNFFEHMGVSPETAEEDACLIEHSLSNETYEKLRQWYEKQDK